MEELVSANLVVCYTLLYIKSVCAKSGNEGGT